MADKIKVGILGIARRRGTFNELGLRSWEESGCATVERVLLAHDGEPHYEIHRPLVLRNVRADLERLLREWCDAPHVPSRCELILTVGGTGFTPQDTLPDAALAVIQRPAPAVAELLRARGQSRDDPEAILSRGTAGMRRRTVIVNLPGFAEGFASEASLTASTEALLPYLPTLVAAARQYPA